MLEFSEKAQAKAERILENYDYALITILGNANEYGDCEIVGEEKHTDIDEIEHLYNTSFDIQIETPKGCNY